MQHLDEGTIHAWLDGALSPHEAREAEAHVASCALCEGRVATARGLIAASSRIAGYLDAVPGKVIPAAKAKTSRWMSSPWPMAIAATLVIGIGLVSTRDKRNVVLPVTPIPPATPGVIRRPATESMPVSQPPREVEPQRAASDRNAPPPRAAREPEVVLPPANAAVQKSSVPVAQPTAAPRPTEQEIASRAARARLDAASDQISAKAAAPTRSAGGGVGGVALGAVASAPPAAAGAAAEMRQVPESPVRVDTVPAFVGCYERLGAETRAPVTKAPQPAPIPRTRGLEPARTALPPSGYAAEERFDRFALMDEAAPTGAGQFAVRTLDEAGRPFALIYGAGWSVLGDRATVRNSQGQIVATLIRTDSSVRSSSVRVISCRK